MDDLAVVHSLPVSPGWLDRVRVGIRNLSRAELCFRFKVVYQNTDAGSLWSLFNSLPQK